MIKKLTNNKPQKTALGKNQRRFLARSQAYIALSTLTDI